VIRINLLPHEETPRIRSFKLPNVGAAVMPICIAIAVLGACGVTFLMQRRSIDRLTKEVEVARAENQRLAPQIARIKQLEREREALDKRLDAIVSLDKDRYLRVHLLSELSRTWPENAWLSEYREINPGSVEIKGYTFNNFVVADFLRDVDRSDYYDVSDLEFAKRGKIQDSKIMEFSLTTSVSQPPATVSAEAAR
jgi:Tfp pilus assembly protein PilN